LRSPAFQHSFTPEALARFSRLFDEVWMELLEEGVLDTAQDPQLARRRLAKHVFRLARSPWSENQMTQLLVRAFRNEAARLQCARLKSRLDDEKLFKGRGYAKAIR
jgi:hypothetical protein